MFEHISYHASRSPNAIAYSIGRQTFSYADLAADLARLIDALSEGPVKPGQRVAVACGSGPLQMMMLIAFQHLNIVTFSAVLPLDAGVRPAIALCDWIYSIEELAELPIDQRVLVDEAWLDTVRRRPSTDFVGRPDRSPDDDCMLVASSGTTGPAKLMMLTRRVFERRTMDRIARGNLTSHTRFAVVMQLGVSFVYFNALATLVCGASVAFPSPDVPEYEFLQSATFLHLLPMQLRRILDRAPADARAVAHLSVAVPGAPLPLELRNRALRMLAGEIVSAYGTNEVMLGARATATAGEYLMSPVGTVQILDESGNQAPIGKSGSIRIRSEAMVDGYWRGMGPSEAFRDGWFHTGDIGVFTSRHTFRVIGRIDTQMNIGGIKIAPEEVEDRLLARSLAREVGACALPDREGIEELHIALVEPTDDYGALLAALQDIFGPHLGNVHVVPIAHIPRAATGKIQRAELRSLLESVRSLER